MHIENNTIKVESKDLGVATLHLPPQYFNPAATEEDKAVLEHFKDQMQEYENGNLKGLILPSVYDEYGNQLFKFEQPVINIVLPSINHIERAGDTLVAYNKPQED